jgi:hypothetical protein
MIDITLPALTRAWLVTTIASGLLFTALAGAQIWNTDVYLRTLPYALQLVGDGPAPIVDRWSERAGAGVAYAARAGQTGS